MAELNSHIGNCICNWKAESVVYSHTIDLCVLLIAAVCQSQNNIKITPVLWKEKNKAVVGRTTQNKNPNTGEQITKYN